jgi:hypothetical protein
VYFDILRTSTSLFNHFSATKASFEVLESLENLKTHKEF